MRDQVKTLDALPEDINDVLKDIEQSYNIKFEGSELHHIRTFGELTDHIMSKLNFEHQNDCTNQQAFYKLRDAIYRIQSINTSAISPKTNLTEIFPRKTRRESIMKIEGQLDVNLHALRPKHFVTYALLGILLTAIFFLFVAWQIGLGGVIISIFGFWLAEKTGKEFKDKTLGELTNRMTQLNYVKSRRDTGTINRNEISGKIEKLFIEQLGLEVKNIDRDTTIV